MKKIFFSSLIISFFISCARDFDPISNNPIELRDLTINELKIVSAVDKFGLKLFREVVNQDNDQNIFISPLSVSMALGMTLNGANGSTYDAMLNTLEFEGMNQREINEAYNSLIDLLTQVDPKVIMQIANSIWYRQGWTFEQSFIDVNRNYFYALVKALDFTNPASVDIINNWVDQNTNHKITKILEQINPEEVMFLINALYFKGTWQFEFDKNDTQDDLFFPTSGSQVPCKMMKQENDFSYFSNADFQAIELPYGNGNFSMFIFLPYPGKNIDSLIDQFNEENWNNWLNSFTVQTGELRMPKFKLEYKITLNDVLKTLGMNIAFQGGQADFSNMYKGPYDLFISRVDHKTFVNVDEEGTEAAAVTVVVIGVTSVGEDFSMIVNRPFVFVIREKHSGSLLFMGKIVEPTL